MNLHSTPRSLPVVSSGRESRSVRVLCPTFGLKVRVVISHGHIPPLVVVQGREFVVHNPLLPLILCGTIYDTLPVSSFGHPRVPLSQYTYSSSQFPSKLPPTEIRLCLQISRNMFTSSTVVLRNTFLSYTFLRF